MIMTIKIPSFRLNQALIAELMIIITIKQR